LSAVDKIKYNFIFGQITYLNLFVKKTHILNSQLTDFFELIFPVILIASVVINN